MYYKTATLGQIINKTMYGWKDVTFITDKVISKTTVFASTNML